MREIGPERLGARGHEADRPHAQPLGIRRSALVSGRWNVAGPASAAPASRRRAGSSSSSSPTSTESGLPGSPTTTRPSRSPHQVGPPGLHGEAPEQLLDAERRRARA